MPNAALLTRAQDGAVGDENPAAKPRRRRFSAEYKLAILEEYKALSDPGAKGALLRREGLCSSHLVEWRRSRDLGALWELAPKARPAKRSLEQVELDRARRRIDALESDLAKHRLALEIQGKAFGALGAASGRERRHEQAADVIEGSFADIEPLLGTKASCAAVGRPRASHYRRRACPRPASTPPRPTPPNALSAIMPSRQND